MKTEAEDITMYMIKECLGYLPAEEYQILFGEEKPKKFKAVLIKKIYKGMVAEGYDYEKQSIGYLHSMSGRQIIQDYFLNKEFVDKFL